MYVQWLSLVWIGNWGTEDIRIWSWKKKSKTSPKDMGIGEKKKEIPGIADNCLRFFLLGCGLEEKKCARSYPYENLIWWKSVWAIAFIYQLNAYSNGPKRHSFLKNFIWLSAMLPINIFSLLDRLDTSTSLSTGDRWPMTQPRPGEASGFWSFGLILGHISHFIGKKEDVQKILIMHSWLSNT